MKLDRDSWLDDGLQSMKLVLVAERCGENSCFLDAAHAAGWEVAAELGYAQVDKGVTRIQADAAVLVSRCVDETVLRTVRALNTNSLMPVVLFTEDSMQPSIQAAVRSGVSAYVANCTDTTRLGSLLDVAVIRFNDTQMLKKELHKAKATLAERGTVEKAKGIIMRQRNISEDEAYQLLRKLAMSRNRRIGEVAGEVIAAAELLI